MKSSTRPNNRRRTKLAAAAAFAAVSSSLFHATPVDAIPGKLRRQLKPTQHVETPDLHRNVIETEEPPAESIPQQYIVGGTTAPKDRYGYYTSVYQRYGSVDYHICGASLITPDIVLTAAHCAVDAHYVRIGAYTHYVNSNGGAPMYQTAVSSYLAHPSFFTDKYERLHYDFALLKLKNPVTDPELLKSIISLDLTGEQSQRFMSGSPLTTIGLGMVEDQGDVAPLLQEVDVLFVPKDMCYKKFHGGINEDTICAWANGKDACGGDSGGPLIMKGDSVEKDVQVAITSWGAECASKFPGVYSYISHVSTWLKEGVCDLTKFPTDEFGCKRETTKEYVVINKTGIGAKSQEDFNPKTDHGIKIDTDAVTEDRDICEDKGEDCSWIETKSWPKFWCLLHQTTCSKTCGKCSKNIFIDHLYKADPG